MKYQYFLLPIFFFVSFFAHSPLEKVLSEHGISGGSYAFYSNGKTETVSEGTLSIQSVVPINEHTRFRIGDVTTAFLTHVLARLRLDQRIGLEDSASKYLSRRMHVPFYGTQEISLKDLAAHTSGLPKRAFHTSHFADLQSRALYSFLNSYTLSVEPGRHVEYAPAAIALLSVILQRAAKEPMSVLIDTAVCRPLQLCDTGYSVSRKEQAFVSLGHTNKSLVFPKTQENRGSAFYDAVGLYSSSHDLLKLISCYLSSEKGAESIQNILFADKSRPLGLLLKPDEKDVFYLTSKQMGFSTFFLIDVSKKKGFALLLNREDVPIENIGDMLFRSIDTSF